MALLAGAVACGEPATEAPPVAAAPEGPSAETLRDLRGQARSAPEATLKRLEAIGEGEADEAVARIRGLAETTRFNDAVKAIAATPELRQAIGDAVALANRPAPTNKQRLARPVWGIIGKLEARTESEPAFVKAAATRLLADDALLSILGPTGAQRLATVRDAAMDGAVRARLDKILRGDPPRPSDFSKAVTVLDQLMNGKARAGERQQRVALERLTAALEAREDEAVRGDAIALLERSGLRGIDEALTTRIEGVIGAKGAERLKAWASKIRAATRRPAAAARLGCEAGRFAHTQSEGKIVEAAMAPVVAQLERGAERAATDYITAIAARDFAGWRRLEQPFMEAGQGSLETFRDQRLRWIGAAAALDPRGVEWQIALGAIDLCKVRGEVTVTRADRPGPMASMAVCWHTERAGWFPCRPLTGASESAIVRP